MKFKIISKSDLIPSVWDGGKTHEYFIFPADSSYAARDFDFRISSASIEKTPSNFTRFENYQRYLVMLDNELRINRNGIDEKYSKNEIFPFDSADIIQSFSLGNDFNLMIRKGEKVFQLNVQTLHAVYEHAWMFVFAIAETMLKVNQAEITLKNNDLLIIENHQAVSVILDCNHLVIFGWMR